MADTITCSLADTANLYAGQMLRLEPSPDLWIVVSVERSRVEIRRARWWERVWHWIRRLVNR